jgi:hypothetical protein
MAPRQIKMPAKNNQAEQEAEEVFSQSKRPERGRFATGRPTNERDIGSSAIGGAGHQDGLSNRSGVCV